MLFKWNDNYSVGISEIDEQHQHFFELANNIHELLIDDVFEKRHELVMVFEELANYAFYHFDTEEVYLRKFQCEVYEFHIRKHNEFRNRIKNYLHRIMEGGDVSGLNGSYAIYGSS